MLMHIGILIFAIGLVSLAIYSIIGEPSLKRLYNQNEIARFNPSLGHGIIQLLGEAFLLAIVAFIARKWLRIRL
jgi:putative lipase involved disintegration of autophagic bodies